MRDCDRTRFYILVFPLRVSKLKMNFLRRILSYEYVSFLLACFTESRKKFMPWAYPNSGS